VLISTGHKYLPVTDRPLRFAAKKARLALKTDFKLFFFHFNELPCFIPLYLSVLANKNQRLFENTRENAINKRSVKNFR